MSSIRIVTATDARRAALEHFVNTVELRAEALAVLADGVRETAAERVLAKARALIAKSAGGTLTLVDALKLVRRQDPELFEQYVRDSRRLRTGARPIPGRPGRGSPCWRPRGAEMSATGTDAATGPRSS